MVPTIYGYSRSMCSFADPGYFLGENTQEKEKPPTFTEFVASIKDVLKEKGRWLYALFAIGGICMFILFGVLYYLSETLESEFAMKGIVKGLVLAIPLAALCLFPFSQESGSERVSLV